MKRIKLLQEYALTIRCSGCGNLMIVADPRRPARLGCTWSEIVDADLRTPLTAASRKSSPDGGVICRECAAKPPINFNRLSMEQLQQFQALIDLLLGDEKGVTTTSTPIRT